MIKTKIGALAGVVLLALGLAACGSSSSTTSSSSSTSSSSTGASSSSAAKTATAPPTASGTISGAGSTFAAPVYEQWGSAQSGLTDVVLVVDIEQRRPQHAHDRWCECEPEALESKIVDFGASDPPLKAEETTTLEKVGPVVQVPMFFGAITVSYNLPGVKTGLKLDGKTIADIYLGTVKTWNDPEIKALNPGVTLPSTPITVIHRSDSSGTSAGFTGFLASVDPEWKSKVGEGKDVQWPTGTGAKGNAGVAGAVQQTTGAVGYVEQAYALQHKFTYASVKNKAGKYVEPTLASTTAAGVGIKVPANLGFKVSNPASPAAYPITSQTFIVVYKDMCKAGVPGGEAAAKGVAKFLEYGLGSGQSILAQADYAALPAAILAKSKAALSSLECNGSPLG